MLASRGMAHSARPQRQPLKSLEGFELLVIPLSRSCPQWPCQKLPEALARIKAILQTFSSKTAINGSKEQKKLAEDSGRNLEAAYKQLNHSQSLSFLICKMNLISLLQHHSCASKIIISFDDLSKSPLCIRRGWVRKNPSLGYNTCPGILPCHGGNAASSDDMINSREQPPQHFRSTRGRSLSWT